jgi:hypothetical protein
MIHSPLNVQLFRLQCIDQEDPHPKGHGQIRRQGNTQHDHAHKKIARPTKTRPIIRLEPAVRAPNL